MKAIEEDVEITIIEDTWQDRFLDKVRNFVKDNYVYSISYSTNAAKELFDGEMVKVTEYSAFIIYRGN